VYVLKRQLAGACGDETVVVGGLAPYDPTATADVVPEPPVSAPPRRAANARERDRTHSVNSAFLTLRTLIPTKPADRKLSKIEPIRPACDELHGAPADRADGRTLRRRSAVYDSPSENVFVVGGGGDF